jgi:hypothetical protein
MRAHPCHFANAPSSLSTLSSISIRSTPLPELARNRKEVFAESKPGRHRIVLSALEGFACVAGAIGETERAARLWGAAQVLHETKSIPRDIDFVAEADARISAVRLGMGEEIWEEAWRKGRVMTLDEAVSCALVEEEDAGS